VRNPLQLVGGLVHDLVGSKTRASARPSTFSSARALDAAIAAATFFRREPNDDGERIIVSCPALGGYFIYSRQEVERRIMLAFPGLVLEEVAAAARFLEDSIRAHTQPIEAENRRLASWVHGWAAER
jgi:hypothetical protein